MADQEEETSVAEEGSLNKPRRRIVRRLSFALGAVLAAGLAFVWVEREKIADSIIAGQFEGMDIPATYEIESIGPDRQVLRNIVIGNSADPDLTIERLEVTIVPRLGLPTIGDAVVTRARIFGSYRDGKLSFGALDPLIFPEESEEPATLPDIDLTLIDARGLIESDLGPMGLKAEGRGNLESGFRGILAANAPRLASGGCDARGVTLYGQLATSAGRPRFSGPMRLAALQCAKSGLAMRDAAVSLKLQGDKDLAGVDGDVTLRAGRLAYGTLAGNGLGGTGKFIWREAALKARYDLAFRGLASPQASIAQFHGRGTLRARDGFSRYEWHGDWEGKDVALGDGLAATLADMEKSTQGSFLSPMARQVRTALLREGKGSTFAASTVLRNSDGKLAFVLPQGVLRGGSGAPLLSLSRIQASFAGSGADGNGPRLSGNFSTGGAGLPRVTGRMEQRAGGDAIFRLAMPEYRAGEGRLAVPGLVVAQRASGAIGFAGSIEAGGPLPGGAVEELVVPVDGNWSKAGGLSVWRRCTSVAFRNLAAAGVSLTRRSLNFCPEGGGAILRSDGRGTRLAAVSGGLDLVGRMGQDPVRISSGALRLAMPGASSMGDVAITLGQPGAETSFRLARLTARMDQGVSGTFDGGQFKLAAVPLDILDAAGNWRYANGRFALDDGNFRVEDRETVDRFQPMIARDARLGLTGNVIDAQALLREPTSDREVTRVDIRHDLGSGIGHADLFVDRLLFDNRLQPDMLSGLVLGVVANAAGTVAGKGRIDWNPEKVTSSGRFSTDGLDFAAAFGPAKGVSGTIVFSDLLNFETPPNQRFRIAEINPGIEVNDGEIAFQLQPGNILAVEGGRWPFVGGTLTLQPVRMRVGVAETRRYVLVIEGMDAALFLERMELGNISATGTFDGTVPLIFDENGGRLEGGVLVSRPPGGNFSYVGDLTYEDLSPIANFAFDALRSIDYRVMQVATDGPLTGEIVTRVRFEGVTQGAGTTKNFLTKQVAKLPIRFNVNIRAPFYNLITSVKAMYDPAFIRDPREMGLLDEKGQPVSRAPDGERQVRLPARAPIIQDRESEKMP